MVVSGPVRWSLLLFTFCFRSCFALVAEDGPPLSSPVSEAELRSAIESVEELDRGLETGCKAYRESLNVALHKLGYGPYHPLFRTSLNGFEQDQIDLEAADEFKMGSFAFSLKTSGQPLTPDPFNEWAQVQNRLDRFEATVDSARKVVTRADIYVFKSTDNTPREVFQKLKKRWRAAVAHANQAYEHALAVRAVLYDAGEMVPAPETFRFIYEGGKYAVICLFGQCPDQSIGNMGEWNKIPPSR